MRKDAFVPNEYYHIYNRVMFSMPEFRVSKNADRLEQAFLLANSTKSAEAFQFLRNNKDASLKDAIEITKQGNKLVDVLCYSIMPDHYHLLVKEIQENGIVNFVRKCDISISKYINISQDRKGPLFESFFKSKHVSTNEYLIHLSVYIHLNPLDFISGKEWRQHKLKNWTNVKNNLLKYKWSSLKSFLNPSEENKIISGQQIILDQFNTGENYESFLRDWSEESMTAINTVVIE